MSKYHFVKERIKSQLRQLGNGNDSEHARLMRRVLFYIDSGTESEYAEIPELLEWIANYYELNPYMFSDGVVDAIREILPREDEEERIFVIKNPHHRDYTEVTLKYSDAGYIRILFKDAARCLSVEDIPALIAWLEKWQKEEA